MVFTIQSQIPEAARFENSGYSKESKKIFPESELQSGLRKCVVTKHNSLLYEIQSESIFILTIIDTRQDQDKINEEIRKQFG